MAAKDEEDSCFSLGWLFTFIRIYFGETLSCQRCFQKMLCVDIKIMMYAIKILLLHTEDIHTGSESSRVVKRSVSEVVQSGRSPLLGPSPG